MRWLVLLACAGFGLAVNPAPARAGGWGNYGCSQPWRNIFAKRNGALTAEEERLQRFWHDYYEALGRYYKQLDHIDWVAYYKNHGYQISAGCGTGGCGACQRIQFAPVFVSPNMQWAVPGSALNGPPAPPGHVACKVPPEAKAEARPPASRKARAERAGPKPPPQGAAPNSSMLLNPPPNLRSPDDFELFLERILDAPRGPAPKAPTAQALPPKGDAPPRPRTADDSRPFGERLIAMLRGEAPKAPPQGRAPDHDLYLQAALRLRGPAPKAPPAQAPPPGSAATYGCVR